MVTRLTSKRSLVLALLAFSVVAVLWFIASKNAEYQAAAKVYEGINMSAGARTASGIICLDGQIRAGMVNEDPEVGLPAPKAFNGERLKSVTLSVPDQRTVIVTVVYKHVDAGRPFGLGRASYVDDGATLIFRRDCSNGRILVDTASTLPEKYWPREYLPRPAASLSSRGSADPVLVKPAKKKAPLVTGGFQGSCRLKVKITPPCLP